MTAFLRMVRLGAAVALVLSCSCEPAEPPDEIARTVRTMVLEASTQTTVRRVFTGMTRSAVETRLSFRTPGQVDEVLVEEGDQIDAGAVVARLDAADYALKADQAKASLEKAKAAYEEASLTDRRMRELYDERAVARSDYDAARTAARAAKAQVDAARRRLDLARRRLSYTVLESPAAGSISFVSIERGENVPAGKPVAGLTAEASLEVLLAIPASAITHIETGDMADVSLPEISGAPSCQGKATEVGESPPPRRAAFPAIVRLIDPPEDALPGMAAQVAFSERTVYDEPRFYVPLSAVGEDHEGRPYVFVVQTRSEDSDEAAVEKRLIDTAERIDARIAIIHGVEEGERIVTRGVSRLDDGEGVRLSRATRPPNDA